jgi:actin-like ATPase involved in cell morphogenesis
MEIWVGRLEPAVREEADARFSHLEGQDSCCGVPVKLFDIERRSIEECSRSVLNQRTRVAASARPVAAVSNRLAYSDQRPRPLECGRR